MPKKLFLVQESSKTSVPILNDSYSSSSIPRSTCEMMEEGPCGFIGAKDVKSLYLINAAQRSCLDKPALLFASTSEPMTAIGDHEHIEKGCFYQIDHSKLSPKSPEQLKFIRVVMVCDKTELQVSLRYPSIHSLRTHFSEGNFEKPDGKKIPALDEKFAMRWEFAREALYRRIPIEEFSEKRNSWSFWVMPSEENEKEKCLVLTDEVTNLVRKEGTCWSELKCRGMVQWGKRRQVRFLGRHEETKLESLSCSVEIDETGRDEMQPIDFEGGTVKKRKNGEEAEAVKAVSLEVIRRTRQSQRNQHERSGFQKSKKTKENPQNQVVVYKGKKRKTSIDRWSAERYKLAEENMLKVMKAKGAVYGNPILRPDLRLEARKLIGDTGLLDHLLKHMAGKVTPNGTERFRRRINADGAMEYWLESADLVNVRREEGIQDPYWTPPPGWKPGDNPLQDSICAREIRKIKEEIAKLKHDMQELLSKKHEEALAIVTTPNSCLSSLNLDSDGSSVPLQEIYVELVNKKDKIKEQLKEISQTLSDMEEQMSMLKSGVEEPIMSESVTPPALFTVGSTTVRAGHGRETKEEEDRSIGRTSAEEQFNDVDKQRPESRISEDKAAKVERLKSGFQIVKPKGTFLWSNLTSSPQPDDLFLAPTPPSVSSSATCAPQLQQVPNPSAPVKPLAERRPVSTSILTHVTNPFTPTHPSPPMGIPKSKVTAAVKATLINLNEVPTTQSYYDTSFSGTLTSKQTLSSPHI